MKSNLKLGLVGSSVVVAFLAGMFLIPCGKSGESLGGSVYNRVVEFSEGITVNSTAVINESGLTLGPTTAHVKSTQTTAPTASQNSGTPTIKATSTDTAGSVTTDTTEHTTVTVTFNATYTTAPLCVISAGDSDAAAIVGSAGGAYVTSDATSMTITHAASSASAVWNYVCVGIL